MQIAAIYDIHGNLPALEAVLRDIGREEVDLVLVGGDVVPGPMPRETLHCLLDLDLPVQFIQGNGEAAVLAEMEGRESAVPEPFQAVIRHSAHQLQSEHDLLANWAKTFRVSTDGVGEVLFCHATPRNNTEIFTRLTPEDRIRPAFVGVGEQLVVCGHTHMQFDRTIASIRVVNAGSVGMPFGKPGAYWLTIGRNIEFRHTLYDLVRAAERIQETTYPDAIDFATHNVLQPPSEEKMFSSYGANPAERNKE